MDGGREVCFGPNPFSFLPPLSFLLSRLLITMFFFFFFFFFFYAAAQRADRPLKSLDNALILSSFPLFFPFSPPVPD